MAKKYSKEYMRQLGSKGGKTTVKKYGKEYMKELARKRWREAKGGGELSARYFKAAIKQGYFIPVVPDGQVEDWLRQFPRSVFVRESVAVEVFRENQNLQRRFFTIKKKHDSNTQSESDKKEFKQTDVS